MINKLILFLLISINVTAQVSFTRDTTLQGIQDFGGKVVRIDCVISGNAIIRNALIEASQFRQIFDTTITLGVGVKIREFSTLWFGASPSNTDNTIQIQKCIDACIDRFPLFIPSGVYKYAMPLTVKKITQGGTYQQCSIKMYGEGTYWNSSSVLWYTGVDSFAFGIQLNKGSRFSGFTIRGGWVSPSGSDTTYYNRTMAQYNNQGLGGNAKGFVVDFFGDYGQRSGTTGILFTDMIVEKFETCVKVSNGYIQNGEILYFDFVQIGDCRKGFETSQPQEKGNHFTNIFSWGRVHTLFNVGVGSQAGNYYIRGANVAGGCIRLFNIANGGFFPTFISDIYSENIGSVGIITTSLSVSIRDCVFDFIAPNKVGQLNLITTNTTLVKFSDCIFRYNIGSAYNLNFTGPATYDNCTISGSVVGAIGASWENKIPTIIQGSQVRMSLRLRTP